MNKWIPVYYVASRDFGNYALQPVDLWDTKRYRNAFSHADSEHAIVLFSDYESAAIAAESWTNSVIVPIEVRYDESKIELFEDKI